MSLRIEALTARMDLLNEAASITDTLRASRDARLFAQRRIPWATPTNPKFQDFYKKATTPDANGAFPPAAFYIRKKGRTQVKQASDIMTIHEAAALKEREARTEFQELDKAIKSFTTRQAEIQALLNSPPEALTPADLLLSADELETLIRTELGPDAPDARYDDSQAARLATATSTQADADEAADFLKL